MDGSTWPIMQKGQGLMSEQRLQALRNLGRSTPTPPTAERFAHILAGNGPAEVYRLKTRFDLLCYLAPPPELLTALEKQQQRSGNVPPATLEWLERWRQLEGE